MIFMNITKKSLLWCLILCANLSFSKIEAKQKASGLVQWLFPIPTALYNAGCNTTETVRFRKINSDFEIFYPHEINTTFEDVAGLTGAKEDMQDVIDFLKNPEKFKNLGAHIPKGILMNGGPGNGKTLLARA